MAELNWSDTQWQKVKDCVTEGFGKASVASAFLPMYGPLPGSTEIVRNERLIARNDTSRAPTISLDGDYEGVNVRLVNVRVNVELSSEQVAEETLSNAMLAFRRAANILAQQEDRIVFDGFLQGPRSDEPVYVVSRGEPQRGLADLRRRQDFDEDNMQQNQNLGQAAVSAVVRAIQTLEDRLHSAPFACVMGNVLFSRVHDPSRALVLPADRITPLLKGGFLLRSGQMNQDAGIVVSLAGNAVDIVVGTPPTVQFLQRTQDARFLFRVFERFALRIRDAATPPVAGFRIQRSQAELETERQTLDLVATERKFAQTTQGTTE